MIWAVSRLGLLGVVLLMIPESACIPVPSEVTLMAAGFGVGQGAFGFPAAIIAATAGNLIGSLIAYALGRRGGMSRLPEPIAKRCEGIFEKYGTGAVFVGRLLPLARTFVSLPAGDAGVPIGRFVALTVAGCAIWSAAFVIGGYFAGAAWQEISAKVGPVSLAIGGLVILWILLRPRASAPSRSRSRSAG
jgi:membrane protein DedA with SNARE-associated domain